MKKLSACGLAVLAAAASAALAGDIDHRLKPLLQAAPAGGTISTPVFLNDQVDPDALNARLDREQATFQRRQEVIARETRELAAITQDAFPDDLRELQTAGRVERVQAHWLSESELGLRSSERTCYRTSVVKAFISTR